MEPIILASSSPRRQEILRQLSIPFQVITPNVDESNVENVKLEEIPEYLARAKVESVLNSLPKEQEVNWILGSDTLVIMGNKIYGKPQNEEEAFKFMKELSGKEHTVITAIVLYNGRKGSTSSKTGITKVSFKSLSDEEIQWYLDAGEWHGAAGGYRIQSLASVFIDKIEGTQSCVTGLPISLLYDILKEQNYSILE